ncbi:hypothetical protein L484_010383 [Morus notabilis]|uniref:Uncharacterized protein n=1 Tax=Morus notabilis TaxID=981085 RepID=W9SNQ5_9ROSA|nr:hypothetical protein L484_010383 [Morus notabilis]
MRSGSAGEELVTVGHKLLCRSGDGDVERFCGGAKEGGLAPSGEKLIGAAGRWFTLSSGVLCSSSQ